MTLSRGGTFSAPFVVTYGKTEHSQKSLDLVFRSFILGFGLFQFELFLIQTLDNLKLTKQSS